MPPRDIAPATTGPGMTPLAMTPAAMTPAAMTRVSMTTADFTDLAASGGGAALAMTMTATTDMALSAPCMTVPVGASSARGSAAVCTAASAGCRMPDWGRRDACQQRYGRLL